MENTTGQALYDLLVTKDFEPEMLDSAGKPVTDASEADLFSFDWKTPNKNYGTVVALLGTDGELEIYFGDNLGRGMEGDDKKAWYAFLEQMKKFATRNLLTFELNNLNRLKYTMQGMAAIREGLFEGYYGSKKVSYSDQPTKTRLMIKHSRDLGEGEARYRAIESIFVETADGERFKVPSRSLMHGKMLARHIAEGGNPYDAFGNHINQMISEMATLSKFVRAARNKDFQGEAADLVETAIRHYSDLKAKAKRMITRRGYHETRQNFDPSEITAMELTTEALREMFIEQSLDHRIEEALPVLARLATETPAMKEVDEFASWAETAVQEGTWATPKTPEQRRRLQDLLNQEIPVGTDATNATELLYDLLGDDTLFDQLQDLATSDPEADARPLIQKRMQELGLLDETLKGAPTGGGAGTLNSRVGHPVQDMEEDLDTDGVMMTKPSNMSSESKIVDLKRLRRLALI